MGFFAVGFFFVLVVFEGVLMVCAMVSLRPRLACACSAGVMALAVMAAAARPKRKRDDSEGIGRMAFPHQFICPAPLPWPLSYLRFGPRNCCL
jgi:hypothetical protein